LSRFLLLNSGNVSIKMQAKSLFFPLGMAGIKQGGAAFGKAKTLGPANT